MAILRQHFGPHGTYRVKQPKKILWVKRIFIIRGFPGPVKRWLWCHWANLYKRKLTVLQGMFVTAWLHPFPKVSQFLYLYSGEDLVQRYSTSWKTSLHQEVKRVQELVVTASSAISFALQYF